MKYDSWHREKKLLEEQCKEAFFLARKNLQQLLEDNKHTEYGRKYDFSEIDTAEEYQKKVPLSDYTNYREYVRRMRKGERDILTSYEVEYYILTSGSTGEQKRIPLTKTALERMVPFIYHASFLEEGVEEDGKYLHISIFHRELEEEEQDTILSVAYYSHLLKTQKANLDRRYLGTTALLFSKEVENVPYVKAWIAFSSLKITGIQAIFLYDILLFCHWLELHWKDVIRDMEQRKIPDAVKIPDRVRKELLALPAVSKERLYFLKNELEKGMEGILERLWPEIKFVNGISSTIFFVQEDSLRKYLGKIPVNYFCYAASECMIAAVLRGEEKKNVLLPENGFFEFIPYENGITKEEEIKNIWELEEGKTYEMVVTNFSGLYRYRMNDIVRVTGFYYESPLLEVCFRRNQLLNIAGEKLNMEAVSMAMKELENTLQTEMTEFSVVEDIRSIPGNYLCFIEITDEKEIAYPKEELGHLLDEILKQTHDDYREVRLLEMIEEPKVYMVRNGTHKEHKERLGSLQAQNKPLQYLANPESIEFMIERIR